MDVREGVRTQEKADCLLCGAAGQLLYSALHDRLYDTPGEWDFLECPACGLVWLSPCPVPPDIPKLYAAYYTHQAISTVAPQYVVAVRKVAADSDFGQKLMDVLFKVRLFDLLSAPSFWRAVWFKNGQQARFLDVGCGNGSFLAAMRDFGWDVVGVEPDTKAVAVARNDFGLDVKVGTLEDVRFPTGVFDVVRMNHVIEHLPDPIHTLRECYRVLRPGGRLVIYTPNIASWGHRFGFQNAWLCLDPPRHLNLFSARTLKLIAERVAFRVDAVYTVSRGASHTWMTSWRIRQDGILSRDWRKDVPWQVRIQAQIVKVLEAMFCRVKNVGEDLEMVVVKEPQ
jgi:2-polyprenyl-3-methyl-5-hydroxy-6-metoxy-1,4-benzoquinol methylase